MRTLLIILCLAAGSAYLTKPSVADAETVLRQEVMGAVARQELGEGRGMAETLALAACKLSPSDCYELLRAGLDVTFEDRMLYLKVDVAGFERRASCYGLFSRFVCPGGFSPG